jgi:uncharacterized protein (TIGR03067 family)
MNDVDLLQGSWRVVQILDRGEECDDGEVAFYWFVRDRLTIGNPDEAFESAFRLDPTTDPKPLDLFGLKGTTPYQIGIYRLEPDRLVHCHADDFAPRPTDFESSDQTGLAPRHPRAVRRAAPRLTRRKGSNRIALPWNGLILLPGRHRTIRVALVARPPARARPPDTHWWASHRYHPPLPCGHGPIPQGA